MLFLHALCHKYIYSLPLCAALGGGVSYHDYMHARLTGGGLDKDCT